MDQYEKWPILSKNLRCSHTKYFLEIQDLLEGLEQQLYEPKESESIVLQIDELLNHIVQVVHIENQQLLHGFGQSLKLLVQIDCEERVQRHQAMLLCQELFSKVAIGFFYDEPEVEKKETNQFVNDGTSTCSDFSDDNFEVEDFEQKIALELFELIRTNLLNPEIEQKCWQFEFLVCNGEINLFDFFQDALKIQVKHYDLILFLNYSGLLQKMINCKHPNQLEYFIQQTFFTLNRIKNESIEDLVDSNCFEMKYSRLSQRKFLRCKILAPLYEKIVYEKLEKWRQSQQIQEIQGQSVKELRRFIIENKAPLSRWEVSILSIQDVQNSSENLFQKLQKLVIALQLDYQFLLENFIAINKIYVDAKEFSTWVRLSEIPLLPWEIAKLFEEQSQVHGYYAHNGIKVVQRLDYYTFIDRVFGVETNKNISKEFKYSDELTLQQYSRHLQLRLVDASSQLQNLKEQYLALASQQGENEVSSTTDSTNQQEQLIRQDITYQAELAQLKQEHEQQMKMMDVKWKSRTKDLLLELEHKDRQIEQHRMQLEALIKELEWVKTERM